MMRPVWFYAVRIIRCHPQCIDIRDTGSKQTNMRNNDFGERAKENAAKGTCHLSEVSLTKLLCSGFYTTSSIL